MNFPVIIQMYSSENGLTTLAMMLAYYKKYVPLNELREHCSISRNGTSIESLCSAATYFGLNTNILNINADEALNQNFPIVVSWNKQNYAIVIKKHKNHIEMVDAVKGNYNINLEKFHYSYSGKTIIFNPSSSFTKTGKKSQFIPYILDYIKNTKSYFFLIVILTSIITLINTILIHLQKEILDNITTEKTLTESMYYISIDVFFIIFILILNCCKTNSVYHFNLKKTKTSINKLITKILNLPLLFFEKSYNCELIERLDTTINIDNIILNNLIPKLINCFTTLIYIYLMIRYDIRIATICFIIEIIHSVIMIAMQRKYEIIQRSTTTSSVNSNVLLISGLNTLKTIKTNGSERPYFSSWYEYQNEYEKSYTRGELFSEKIKIVSSLHSTLTSAIILFVGAYFVMKGNITLSILSAFQVLYNNFHSSISNILEISEYIEKIKNNIMRIDDINNEKEIEKIPLKGHDEKEKLEGTIKVDNVSFAYNSADEPTIQNISFEVKKGELVALVGPSGCGKSTLLKNLSATYTPKKGSILYDYKKRNEIPDIIFHNSLANTDQSPIIFEGSIKNNIKLFNNNITDEKVISATKFANIYDRIMKEKEGFNQIINKSQNNFSGGELQRIELSRAISIAPSIMLLDEFTSALDTISEKMIFDEIKKYNKTCIIAAHRLSTVIQCDKILVMNHGKIIASGKHNELYKSCDLYRQLVDNK